MSRGQGHIHSDSSVFGAESVFSKYKFIWHWPYTETNPFGQDRCVSLYLDCNSSFQIQNLFIFFTGQYIFLILTWRSTKNLKYKYILNRLLLLKRDIFGGTLVLMEPLSVFSMAVAPGWCQRACF